MYTVNRNSNEVLPIPGKKGAIARLIVMGLFVVIALISCVGFLMSADGGFIDVVLETLVSFGTLCTVGAWFWGMMKWIGFIAPKSFSLANTMWCSWHVLTIFGLYIKAMVWALCALFPIAACFATFSPMYTVFFSIAKNGINFFNAMGMLILGCNLVVVLGFVDVCKLRRLCAWEEFKRLLAARKAARA